MLGGGIAGKIGKTEMARLARVIALEVAHHVTQRGNARGFILNSDADREVYLGLFRESMELVDVAVMGYCLMSNHVHLVIVPHQIDALASSLKQTHGRYASYWNAKHGSSGHVWQGRFYSCPLDREHLWEALRYTELNPVRAGMVAEAPAWRWSSAGAHCGSAAGETWLAMEDWRTRWDAATWQSYLQAGESNTDLQAMRQCTHTGRPLGSEEFVHQLEEQTHRVLAPRRGGRPPGQKADGRQQEFGFDR